MLVGETIGGKIYLEKELGSGAMGTVYRARLLEDDRIVALKIIALGLASNEQAVERFEREYQILKQLKHPNIVRLYANGRYKKTPFFAMEYVDGQSLDRLMARRDRFSWEEVVAWGKQLCAALQHAHEKGIIHRDLKPSNLMVTKDGQLKLTDFGIAKDIDRTALTGANNTIGTAAYMSPEQCKGEKNLNAKSDLYSLGIVFYELLTGKKPFVADSPIDVFMMHVNAEFVRPSRLVPEIPFWLDSLVCQLMEKKPEHRPLDAATVAAALEEIETKVSSQKSIGAEIATARVMDKKTLPDNLDAEDREASRAIKAASKKKKLKKKVTPFYQQGWFVILAGLLLVGGMGLAFYEMTRPENPEVLLAAIETATNPDAKAKAIEVYLAAYGKENNEQTKKVREMYQYEKALKRDAIMTRRYYTMNLKSNPEDFDPDAYKSTMEAIKLEAEGNLSAAQAIWRELISKWSNDPEEEKALWGWVGAKRLRDHQEMLIRSAEFIKKLQDASLEEKEPPLTNPMERTMAEGIWLEALEDFPKAYERWSKLVKDLEKDTENHLWFLMAAVRARELKDKKSPTPEERETFLRKRFETAMQLINTPKKEDNALAKQRDGRAILRYLRDCYKNDISALSKIATEADQELAKFN